MPLSNPEAATAGVRPLRWAMISGNYDGICGVADYTRQVAHALSAEGDKVTVFAPLARCPSVSSREVEIVGLPGMMGPSALRRLDGALNLSSPDQVILQYVPQSFGWDGMNLPFCLWLFARRARYRFWMMFHETAIGFTLKQSLHNNVVGAVMHLMVFLTVRAADQIFVSTSSWESKLRRMLGAGKPMKCIPIPSNIPVVGDGGAIAKVKAIYAANRKPLIGHLGTYGAHIPQLLMAVLPSVLRDGSNVLLLGQNSEGFRERLIAAHPSFAGAVHATGTLSPPELSNHIGACDLMVQPYHDGITTRRTTASASLAHGIPIVTTTGRFTEPFWARVEGVKLTPLDKVEDMAREVKWILRDHGVRRRMSVAAKALYQERFALEHTITTLRASTQAISESI